LTASSVNLPTLRRAPMKAKSVLLMLVAVASGLTASYLVSQVIAERNSSLSAEKVSVLVARHNLPMGTLLNEPAKFFEEKRFPKGEEPKKAIRSFEELKDQRLNKPVAAEQFL